MANYNLTSQQIKDSFQQLAQVSGSIEVGVSGYAVLDGTGSRVNTLHVTASNATSASYAPNTGVTSIIAGTNITVDQSTGDVTINSSGGGGSADTGSLLVTSSATNNVITFTKGDGSTYTNTIDTGSGGGGSAFPFTGSAGISGSLNVDGIADVTGLVAGASGILIGTPTTSPVQFPIFKANGDSGLGSIYAGYQISDDSTTANSSMAVSTFTGLDGSNPVFEVSGPGSNRLAWSSANFPYLHLPQLIRAQSGAQITGSLILSQSGLSS
jgi:hypothetical protein